MGFGMTRPYYSLLSRSSATDPWVIEFGDYIRAVVSQERDDMKDDYANKGLVYKIIKTHDGQAFIDSAAAALNGKKTEVVPFIETVPGLLPGPGTVAERTAIRDACRQMKNMKAFR